MTNVLADLARMTSGTTGTGTITLGAAVPGYLTFAGAGITDGQVVSYAIVDGTARETGKGTYTASGTTLTRTVFKSTNSNTPISLSGNEEILITGLAEDFQDIFLMPGWGVLLPSGAYKHGLTTALATGDTDFYTCPAGKRAILLAARLSGTPAAGSVTGFLELHVASTFYRISSNLTVTTAQNFNFVVNIIILDATDKLAVNIATSTGASIFWSVIEFDATAPIFTKRLIGPATGDNTLYTCPAGKSALLLPLSSNPGNSQGGMGLLSDAGGSRNWKGFAVPNGGASGTANQMFPTAAVAASVSNNQSLVASLTAGDFIVVNVDTGAATQLAWINVVESPNV